MIMGERVCSMLIWLVVSTHLKHISQNGNLPQIYRGENKKYGKPPPSLIMRRSYGRKDQQQKNWPVFSRSTPNQLLICSSFGKESRTNQGYFQGPPIMGHLPLSVPLLGVLENPTEQSIKMSDSPTELRRFFTILQRLQAPPRILFGRRFQGDAFFRGDES